MTLLIPRGTEALRHLCFHVKLFEHVFCSPEAAEAARKMRQDI